MRYFKKDDLVFYLYLVYTEQMPKKEITEKKREELIKNLYKSNKSQLIDLWDQVIDCGVKWIFDNGKWIIIK